VIRHTVAFRLRHPAGSTEELSFLDATLALAEIPGVIAFERLRQVGSKITFTFGLSMEFADQRAYDSYNVHPVHVAFVADRWRPEVEDFIETDYVALA